MNCEQCGIEFFEKYSIYSNGKFCSKNCSRKYSQTLVKGTKEANCAICGIQIIVDIRTNAKICKCSECRRIKINALARERYKRTSKREKRIYKESKYCSECGKSILRDMLL